jgi:hypothetical protein
MLDTFRSWDWMTRASAVLITLNVVVWTVALHGIGK